MRADVESSGTLVAEEDLIVRTAEGLRMQQHAEALVEEFTNELRARFMFVSVGNHTCRIDGIFGNYVPMVSFAAEVLADDGVRLEGTVELVLGSISSCFDGGYFSANELTDDDMDDEIKYLKQGAHQSDENQLLLFEGGKYCI